MGRSDAFGASRICSGDLLACAMGAFLAVTSAAGAHASEATPLRSIPSCAAGPPQELRSLPFEANFEAKTVHERTPYAGTVRPATTVLWPRGAFPTLAMRIHAVFVANDDGRRRVRCTPDQVVRWTDEANRVYAGAGLHFDFDPSPSSGDWEELDSTLLNSMTGVDNLNWAQQKSAANAIAARNPGRLVAFFRWGPGVTPTGAGFSWTDYDFVVIPGFDDTGVCGVQNQGLFAHEIGHYLGLAHTFSVIMPSRIKADSFFVMNGRDPDVFDGDGREDTAPDPFVAVEAIQCDSSSLTLGGVVFPLPRTNVMSYYFPVSGVSATQGWTIRQVLALRSGRGVGTLVDAPETIVEEAEASGAVATAGYAIVQDMTPFLGRWSGNRQLLWIDAPLGREMTFDLDAPRAGVYELYASFTAAPDYGIHLHTINGQSAPAIDLYARSVFATGPVDLGAFELREGVNDVRVRAVGSNPHAIPRNGYGLDNVVLVPRSPEPSFARARNVPNPFKASTEMRFLTQPGDRVTVRIYDVTGHEIDRLVGQADAAGACRVTWNGIDARGRRARSGVYVWTVRARTTTRVGRMVLVR